jgi:hypothetical protein
MRSSSVDWLSMDVSLKPCLRGATGAAHAASTAGRTWPYAPAGPSSNLLIRGFGVRSPGGPLLPAETRSLRQAEPPVVPENSRASSQLTSSSACRDAGFERAAVRTGVAVTALSAAWLSGSDGSDGGWADLPRRSRLWGAALAAGVDRAVCYPHGSRILPCTPGTSPRPAVPLAATAHRGELGQELDLVSEGARNFPPPLLPGVGGCARVSQSVGTGGA